MATLRTFVAYLISDKGSELREVYATSQADAMNKIFMTTPRGCHFKINKRKILNHEKIVIYSSIGIAMSFKLHSNPCPNLRQNVN